MMTAFLVVLGALGLGYLLLRTNALWVYRLFDRALRNDRGRLPQEYEVPRYYTTNKGGEVDPAARWPGWDGWYFFLLPDDEGLPVKMVRASLMTGLYGLEGIDTYGKLPPELSAFAVVEYLTLTPTEELRNGMRDRVTHLCQFYLPKATSLTIKPQALDVIVANEAQEAGAPRLYGRIWGAWPEYHFQFTNAEAGIGLELTYQGENLVWWADFPGVFTYFAAFGQFAGRLTWKSGADQPKVYAVTGRGGFEHGFARKPCNFDALWVPVTWLQKIFPALRPVHYHYELLVGDGPHHGGFMYVKAFGIIWRNRGGLYFNGDYRELESVEVEYLQTPDPEAMMTRPGEPQIQFYRRWRIRAQTREGLLEYSAHQECSPAFIASHMAYYYFSYEGTYRGEPIRGRGYGEYVHM